MSSLSEDLVRSLIAKAGVPLVFRGFIEDWPLRQWDLEKWCAVFGDREIPFRCMKRKILSDEPCWERRCDEKMMTFKAFVDNVSSNEEWMYFDYKYLHQWFNADSEMCKNLSWKQFGYGGKGAADSTLWVGSSGAHTPCHQDTYGVNIVAQLYGKKQWILFPPETRGLKPTRVPYEESSVYSELNFYCPLNLEVFKDITGGCLVELNAGDALFVPRGWWHYVQNVDPVSIAVNTWLPHDKDTSSQVSEALIKIFVAQICKDLPEETAKHVVNPNEDDLVDTPLAVLFLQLETVANSYIDNRRKARRAKRQKTGDEDPTAHIVEDFDLKYLIEHETYNLELAQSITGEDLVNILKGNIRIYGGESPEEDEVDSAVASLDLTKAVIDAYCQTNVVELVKQNLLTRLS